METSCRLHVVSFHIVSGWCAMPKVRLAVPLTVPFLCEPDRIEPQRMCPKLLVARKQHSMASQNSQPAAPKARHRTTSPHGPWGPTHLQYCQQPSISVSITALGCSRSKRISKLGIVRKRIGTLAWVCILYAQNLTILRGSLSSASVADSFQSQTSLLGGHGKARVCNTISKSASCKSVEAAAPTTYCHLFFSSRLKVCLARNFFWNARSYLVQGLKSGQMNYSPKWNIHLICGTTFSESRDASLKKYDSRWAVVKPPSIVQQIQTQ